MIHKIFFVRVVVFLGLFSFFGCTSSMTRMDQDQKVASELFLPFETTGDPESLKKRNPGLTCEKGTRKTEMGLSAATDWRQKISILNACVAEKSWEQVEVFAQNLLEHEPRSPWGPFYLSLVALEKDQSQRALWLIQLAERKTPGVGLFEFQKARIYFDLGEIFQSISSAEKALKLDSSLIQAHLFLGDLFFQNENFKLSKLHYKNALKLDQRLDGVNIKLGEIAYREGRLEEARSYFEAAKSLGSNNVYLHYRLGVILKEESKDHKAALDVLRKGLDLQRRTGLESTLNFSEKIKEVEGSIAQVEGQIDQPTRGPAKDGEVQSQ